nr:protein STRICTOSIDINE SYNTHASE-LIKE 7 [Arachis hypogaea]
MSGSKRCDSVSLTPSELQGRRRRTTFFVIVLLLPVVIAAVLFRLDPFEPVLLPAHEISRPNLVAGTLARNDNMRRGSEVVGNGRVAGPEDLVYDVATNVVYTGCRDGWIKRVKLSDDSVSGSEVVEDWVNTGGRPLGVALDHGGALIVGDANKGLLRITKDKKVELLTDEVDGLKFKLTDGVDVAKDGTIYFTDASYKYSLKEHFLDLLEGKPHGRFMSYDPKTKKTKVLVHNLYFPNGVAVSPDQQFIIFCESVLMKCKKYYIEGPKKGSVEKFCDNLPGYPDNIHYDEQGQYWIGLGSNASEPSMCREPAASFDPCSARVQAQSDPWPDAPGSANQGTFSEIFYPGTSQQNGRTKHKHCHILDSVRAMRISSSCLERTWGEAILTTVHIINRLPSFVLGNITPFERLYLTSLDYSSLRVFAYVCFVLIQPHEHSSTSSQPLELPTLLPSSSPDDSRPHDDPAPAVIPLPSNRSSKRTKHIEIDCHFIWQRFLIDVVRLIPVGTLYQTADKFTKAHHPIRFRTLVSKLKMGSTSELDIIFKYPLIRKALGMFAKYVVNPSIAKNGGVISVDLDGKPIAHYSDPKLALASGIKIGDHIYCGSLFYPFILRLDVKQYPAINSSSSKK